jgi:hypothetical protein
MGSTCAGESCCASTIIDKILEGASVVVVALEPHPGATADEGDARARDVHVADCGGLERVVLEQLDLGEVGQVVRLRYGSLVDCPRAASGPVLVVVAGGGQLGGDSHVAGVGEGGVIVNVDVLEVEDFVGARCSLPATNSIDAAGN